MAVHEKNCQLSTFATSAFLVLLTLSRTCCPSLCPVRTNSCALPSASNTVNFIFPAINGRNTRAMKRLLDLQRVHFSNAVWPVFPAREGKNFSCTQQKHVHSGLGWFSQSESAELKDGLPSSKTC